MPGFGTGSNSNGSFWYGNATNFPGFLYKKNTGVGGRKSTKFNPGGNITCNGPTYLINLNLEPAELVLLVFLIEEPKID